MLLPTALYIRTGVAAVALTVLFLTFAKPAFFRAAFAQVSLDLRRPGRMVTGVSIACTAVLGWLLWQGLTGTRDPLENPLPLAIWSIWWILMPLIQALLGDLWHWINPWRGLVRILPTAGFALPKILGHWPSVLTYLFIAAFVTADPAPDDPGRLATILAIYWVITFLGCVIFGEDWITRGEGISVFFTLLARMAPLSGGQIGMPGHAVVHGQALSWSTASVLIVALATASFDGLNETFTWLALIGVNPLEFPGRSAVIWQSLLGLAMGIGCLGGLLVVAIAAGLTIVGRSDQLTTGILHLIPSIVPIAIGYHFAHFLTSFLVGVQYARRSLLGTETYVTTGFFNAPDTIRTIWLTQAGAIVLAHIFALLVSHAIALRLLQSHKKAIVSQFPVSAFMIAYTFFGLWILAQPTGA